MSLTSIIWLRYRSNSCWMISVRTLAACCVEAESIKDNWNTDILHCYCRRTRTRVSAISVSQGWASQMIAIFQDIASRKGPQAHNYELLYAAGSCPVVSSRHGHFCLSGGGCRRVVKQRVRHYGRPQVSNLHFSFSFGKSGHHVSSSTTCPASVDSLSCQLW